MMLVDRRTGEAENAFLRPKAQSTRRSLPILGRRRNILLSSVRVISSDQHRSILNAPFVTFPRLLKARREWILMAPILHDRHNLNGLARTLQLLLNSIIRTSRELTP